VNLPGRILQPSILVDKMAAPKYLTGDPAGIKEFLDKFDVRTD
jgi:hypothetical protein